MIIDSLSNIRQYASILPHLEDALKAIQNADTSVNEKVAFTGGYYMVQIGTTKPFEEGDYEAHEKYIDLQIVAEGSEEISWENLKDTEVIEYLEDKDKVICRAPVRHRIRIDESMFWVAYPNDAHKAIRHTDSPMNYTKIVVKLAID